MIVFEAKTRYINPHGFFLHIFPISRKFPYVQYQENIPKICDKYEVLKRQKVLILIFFYAHKTFARKERVVAACTRMNVCKTAALGRE